MGKMAHSWKRSLLRSFIIGIVITTIVLTAIFGTYYALFIRQNSMVSPEQISISAYSLTDEQITFRLELLDGYCGGTIKTYTDENRNLYISVLRTVIKKELSDGETEIMNYGFNHEKNHQPATTLCGGKGGFPMTCTEEYKEHIEYTFHAFCKIVIRNASYTALRTWSRKHKREISLDYITDEKHYPLGTTDEYFKAPEPDEEYIVHLCGDTVILSNGLLVQALSRLPAQKQEMLYLSFFKRMPQHEIGRRYGRSRSAVGYHIRKAIQQLYEEMEGLAHEE